MKRVSSAIGSLVIAVTCCAQQAPQFDVASIKVNATGNAFAAVALPPGRMKVTNLPVRALINFAYNLQDSKLIGGPDWLGTTRYDVEAKAEGTPTRDQLRLMVQSLLADRFQLAVHSEKREAPVYELTQAKGGLKLLPAPAGSCRTIDRDHPPEPPSPGMPQLQDCGHVGIGPGQINAWGVPIKRVAGALSGFVGRTVLDKTGVTGNYNIIFRFAMDQSIAPEMAGPPGAADASAPPDPAAPNIFVALQEQLGLKLESAKGEVEVLVIDHVERPTQN